MSHFTPALNCGVLVPRNARDNETFRPRRNEVHFSLSFPRKYCFFFAAVVHHTGHWISISCKAAFTIHRNFRCAMRPFHLALFFFFVAIRLSRFICLSSVPPPLSLFLSRSLPIFCSLREEAPPRMDTDGFLRSDCYSD